MEACSTSHFWGRTFSAMGYSVRLIPAQHVKAFVRSQKNDANDALAICETALRPCIHFVSVKTTEQQDIKAFRNTRQLMVEQRTKLVGQRRSLLAEYGVTIPVGIQHLQQQLPELIEDASNNLTFTLRHLLSSLRANMQTLNELVASLDSDIAALSSQQTVYSHLLTIPDVGPLIAAAFISEVDATQFSSGRELSAWCGLVPRQHSYGNIYADMVLVDGAEITQPVVSDLRLETEIAVVLKKDLTQSEHTILDIINAVDILPAFEICDSRNTGWNVESCDFVIDNAAACLVVLGTRPVYLSDCDITRCEMVTRRAGEIPPSSATLCMR
ncbi:IS110 family transposase [Klebsiella variicola]|nr:IS110 family transposase [Klebsiella variicola]MCD9672811.1 IS110 family transposase [Klebsiella variicola subsp. variicola]